MSLMQIHDKADFSDIVLREQISRIIFLVLPQISAVLIKVCQEETYKGSSVVLSGLKALGRFLCLVFEDYEKKSEGGLTSDDFRELVSSRKAEERRGESALKPNNQTQAEFIANLKKTSRWVLEASEKVAPAVRTIERLRGSENKEIRRELAIFSRNLLEKCLPNIESLVQFLLENLLTLADDSDAEILELSRKSLEQLSAMRPELNDEVVEIFCVHLMSMPRIVMTGDESEQIAAFKLLNSLVIIISMHNNEHLNSLMNNQLLLDRLVLVLLSCCEIEINHELMFYENLSTNDLEDKFYKMKKPWKRFKNLKSEVVVGKFSEICKNIGHSNSAETCVNYLIDNMNSVEYLTLLIEIIQSGENLAINQNQIEAVIDEFLSETYWTMQIQANSTLKPAQKQVNEEWFQENTPGLYESAVEVRLKDLPMEVEEIPKEITLKTIKYNILCTCLVLELIGVAASVLQKKFQRYLLPSMHRVLEKAGSSNFIIRTAGIFALEGIASAMGHEGIPQLIDDNSRFVLFNIELMMKRRTDNEKLLDMLSVVFKFSKSSMTNYIKEIVETAAAQMTMKKFSSKIISNLKLFGLYADSMKQWDSEIDGGAAEEKKEEEEVSENWEEFFEEIRLEIEENSTEIGKSPLEVASKPEKAGGKKQKPEKVDEKEQKPEKVDKEEQKLGKIHEEKLEKDTKKEPEVDIEQQHDESMPFDAEPEPEKPKLPEHIALIIKILTSSLQFFASSNQAEVIATHEIFTNCLPILHRYEDDFLPIIHQMWYPFTKQFQVKNKVTLQFSFRLLELVARLAKDFIHKRSTGAVLPVLNNFLTESLKANKATSSYAQEFKLQREILSGYGSLAVSLDLQEKDLDKIVDILLSYKKSSNEGLKTASEKSLDVIRSHDPGLIYFKIKYF